jgi:hypothetical protein
MQIAEAEGDVVVGVEFAEEPGALSVGGEKFDDGIEVEGLISPVDCGALRLAVGEELLGLCIGDECLWSVPGVGGPERQSSRGKSKSSAGRHRP